MAQKICTTMGYQTICYDDPGTKADVSNDILEISKGVADTASAIVGFPRAFAQYVTGTTAYLGEEGVPWRNIGRHLNLEGKALPYDVKPLMNIKDTAGVLVTSLLDIFTPPRNLREFGAKTSMALFMLVAPEVKARSLKMLGLPAKGGIAVAEVVRPIKRFAENFKEACNETMNPARVSPEAGYIDLGGAAKEVAVEISTTSGEQIKLIRSSKDVDMLIEQAKTCRDEALILHGVSNGFASWALAKQFNSYIVALRMVAENESSYFRPKQVYKLIEVFNEYVRECKDGTIERIQESMQAGVWTQTISSASIEGLALLIKTLVWKRSSLFKRGHVEAILKSAEEYHPLFAAQTLPSISDARPELFKARDLPTIIDVVMKESNVGGSSALESLARTRRELFDVVDEGMWKRIKKYGGRILNTEESLKEILAQGKETSSETSR